MKSNRPPIKANENAVSGLPDILEPGLSVVFCGINPGMRSAVVGQHFANRTNRFWRVLHRAGFTPDEILPQHSARLLSYGCGLTSAVERPTVSASHLKRSDFLSARQSLEQKVLRYAPGHFAFLGKPAYAAMFNQRTLSWGRQPTPIGQTTVWVLPNPSGLNRDSRWKPWCSNIESSSKPCGHSQARNPPSQR